MNFLAKNLVESLSERFKDDKAYLSEKTYEIKKHKDKFDSLFYLSTNCDYVTQVDVYKRLAKASGWTSRKPKTDEELELIMRNVNLFVRML